MKDQNATENKREKFVIDIDEHFEFNAIAESKFITSKDFARLTNELFHSVFADYEGCTLEVNGNEPTLALVFNHGEYDEKAITCCERISTKSVGSTVIDRGRSRDNLLKDGDRYYLTEDGKDVISDLLIRRVYNNGNIDLRKVVSEISERGPVNTYFVQSQQQYTKVSYISLDRLCGLLFGTKDEDGTPVEYSANVVAMIPTYNVPGVNVNANYVLNITRVSSKEVADIYNKLGLGVQSGLNIIR